MKRMLMFAACLLVCGGLSAENKKNIVDIDKELKQSKSTATTTMLLETLAETTPQTAEELTILGQLLTRYPTQAQRAFVRISDPKLAKGVIHEFDMQAGKLKAIRAKGEANLTDSDRQNYIDSYMNSVAVIGALGNMKNKEAIPVLRDYLDDSDLAQAASVALGRLGDTESLDRMLANIEKTKTIDLSGYGDKGLVRIVEEIDKPGVKRERKTALVKQISGSRSPERKRLLKELALEHKDLMVRERASQALLNSMLVNSEAGDAAFAAELLKKTKNEGGGYWAMAMFAGCYGAAQTKPDAAGVTLLLDVLKSASEEPTRQLAAKSIGTLKISEALPYLQDCIQTDKNKAIRGECQSAYWEISGTIPPVFAEEDAQYFERYTHENGTKEFYEKFPDTDPVKKRYIAKVKALQEYRLMHK